VENLETEEVIYWTQRVFFFFDSDSETLCSWAHTGTPHAGDKSSFLVSATAQSLFPAYTAQSLFPGPAYRRCFHIVH
jgi:hypothetical protein